MHVFIRYMIRSRPHVIRRKKYADNKKVSGDYKRSQVKRVEKSNKNSDGNYLISMSDDYSIQLYDITHKTLTNSFCAHSYRVEKIEILLRQNILLAFCYEDFLNIWDLKSNSLFHTLPNIQSTTNYNISNQNLIFINKTPQALIFNGEDKNISQHTRVGTLLMVFKRRFRLK